jgi:hypothetical protein
VRERFPRTTHVRDLFAAATSPGILFGSRAGASSGQKSIALAAAHPAQLKMSGGLGQC